MKLRVPAVLIVVSSLVFPVKPALALEPLQGILDCATVKTGLCIEAIYINTQDGKHIKAELTGRNGHMKLTYAPESIFDSDLPEYSVEGIKFGGSGSNKFIAAITYFPIGNRDCFYTPCVEGKEYIQVNTKLSYLDGLPTIPMHYPNRTTDLLCGTKEIPALCYKPANFEGDFEFEYHLRLPRDYTYVDVNARGARSFSAERQGAIKVIDGQEFQTSIFKIRVLAYTTFGVNGADIDQDYGVSEIDQADFVLWGKNSKMVKQFGACSNIQGISVASNAFWADPPLWNPQEQTLSVKLHGAHYKSDGTLNIVYFQTRISTAMAKCLWGVDLAKKISSSVQVSYDSGSSADVQTASSRLEGSDFIFSVAGMHLSEPTVKMKVIEEKVIPSQPNSNGSALKSIKCIKGKSVKVIKGVTPKCPAGFKISK